MYCDRCVSVLYGSEILFCCALAVLLICRVMFLVLFYSCVIVLSWCVLFGLCLQLCWCSDMVWFLFCFALDVLLLSSCAYCCVLV